MPRSGAASSAACEAVAPPRTRHGAGLLGRAAPTPEQLHADAAQAHACVEALRAEVEGLEGWVNVPLFNQSGRADDYGVGPYEGAAQPTPLAERLPHAAAIARWVAAEGFDLELARVAVLEPGAQLRAHVDEYPALRLIVPLEDDPDFRHVFDGLCVSMATGDLWGVQGDVCHGAINLSSTRRRAALLLDARPATSRLPAWYQGAWTVPADRRRERAPFTPSVRAALEARARALVPDTIDAHAPGLYPHEALWLEAAYTHALEHAEAYAELVAFCKSLGLNKRAAFWDARACRCTPE